MTPIRIATRQSKLALWQANHVAARLRDEEGLEVELVRVTTTGDRIQNRTLAEIGGKGLFIKELESAMLEDRADLAVHSMKDVPGDLPEGFVLASILAREDPRDVIVSASGASLGEHDAGTRVGSSSLRRRYQLKHVFPAFDYRDIRGNVDTRLAKLRAGDVDVVILAAAGLKRLELEDEITEYLGTEQSVPAAGQGAVGIECLAERADVAEVVARLNDEVTSRCVSVERAFARRLNAECNQPVGAFAVVEEDHLVLHGFVADAAGDRQLRDSVRAAPEVVADLLAERFFAAGAEALLGE